MTVGISTTLRLMWEEREAIRKKIRKLEVKIKLLKETSDRDLIEKAFDNYRQALADKIADEIKLGALEKEIEAREEKDI